MQSSVKYTSGDIKQFFHPFPDVSLVCCFLPRTQSPWPTQHWGTGYQYSDAGVGGNGKAHWTHPSGAGDRRSPPPSQFILHSWLQLVGQQPDPAVLWAHTQWPAGTAGSMCQDPPRQVWSCDCQVRKNGGTVNTDLVDTVRRYTSHSWK